MLTVWRHVQGRLLARASPHFGKFGFKYEALSHPKYGRLGWNNSVSGEFVYSPREYLMQTTNHGREAERPIPGCEDTCTGGDTGDCPNKDASKGPVATARQVSFVEDEDIGFPCVEHMAPVDKDTFRVRGAWLDTPCSPMSEASV